jgi:3-phenylpropionate/trans-cinnamate dioxygenase ferredoxin subunit
MAMTTAARLSELARNQPTRVDLEGVPVCLVRIDDRVHAVHDTCSHQEYSLSEGLVFDGAIECALHGSMFGLEDGAPDSLPATKPIPTFAVEIDGDDVRVDVDNQTNDAPWPDHF